MISFESAVVAGTTLIRSAIQSPNYVAGVSGWTINQDGSVEFNDAFIRGQIEAGNGAVRLNAGGVKVDGPALQFDINFVGGFLARRILDDGAYGQLTMADSTPGSIFGGGIFLNPPDPTPNGNAYSLQGATFVFTNTVGAVDTGVTRMRSPGFTGLDVSGINLSGESSDGLTRPAIEMQGDVSITGIGHEEWTKYPGPTVVTNSIVPFNIAGTTITLEAGRTYLMHALSAYDGPVAADARFSWAKTNALVSGDRHIRAPGPGAATNSDSAQSSIRRVDATQQVVGTTAGVSNAFTIIEEWIVWTNGSANDEAVQLQFAQGTANVVGCTLQNGYIFTKMIA